MKCENCQQESGENGNKYSFRFGAVAPSTDPKLNHPGSGATFDILGKESAWICDSCGNKNKREKGKELMGIGGGIIGFGAIFFVVSFLIVLLNELYIVGLFFGGIGLLVIGYGYYVYKFDNLTDSGENIAINLKRDEIKNKYKNRLLHFWTTSDYEVKFSDSLSMRKGSDAQSMKKQS